MQAVGPVSLAGALQGQGLWVMSPSFPVRAQGQALGLFMITPTVEGSVSHRRERRVSPGSDVERSAVCSSSHRAG